MFGCGQVQVPLFLLLFYLSKGVDLSSPCHRRTLKNSSSFPYSSFSTSSDDDNSLELHNIRYCDCDTATKQLANCCLIFLHLFLRIEEDSSAFSLGSYPRIEENK